MPRKPRPDIQPEILLADVLQDQRAAQESIGKTRRVKVWEFDPKEKFDGYMYMFDATRRRFAQLRSNGVRLDEGVVLFMMQRCEQAAHKFVLNGDGNVRRRDGKLVARLMRVGCRVYLTQGDIATGMARSRSYVNDQIRRMREHGIIVNQGQGWYEFDVSLCWRGRIELHKAYRLQQIVRDGLVIVQGASIVHSTDDMEDDEQLPADNGESTAPIGSREEDDP